MMVPSTPEKQRNGHEKRKGERGDGRWMPSKYFGINELREVKPFLHKPIYRVNTLADP